MWKPDEATAKRSVAIDQIGLDSQRLAESDAPNRGPFHTGHGREHHGPGKLAHGAERVGREYIPHLEER